MHFDWQTAATLAIGLMAAAYLSRRWWPALRHLSGGSSTAGQAYSKQETACGKQNPATPTMERAGASSCASGCGQCGGQATPAKDHRVHWPKRTQQ